MLAHRDFMQSNLFDPATCDLSAIPQPLSEARVESNRTGGPAQRTWLESVVDKVCGGATGRVFRLDCECFAAENLVRDGVTTTAKG